MKSNYRNFQGKLNFNLYLRFIYFAFGLYLINCSCNSEIKFEKIKWLKKDEIHFIYRDGMLKDLTNNYKLNDLSYLQLTDILGKPDGSNEECGEVYYEISIEYDNNDPIYAKNLIFTLNRDSLILNYRIEEFRKY